MTAHSVPNTLMASLERRSVQLVLFLLVGLVTRAAVFGDLSYFADENFYHIAGLRMHDGLLPYVGIWDRKGPGLFLTYYLITAFGSSVLTTQIAAWLFASLTAFVINLIGERFSGRLGALLAGMLYLAALPLLGGAGGQTPVFYNLWTALAALLVLRANDRLSLGRAPGSLFAAMALAGFAITYKQTAVVEGAFLGVYALWRLSRGGMELPRLIRTASLMALCGLAPFAAFALVWAALGHFAEFWHAMVTANLAKPVNVAGDQWVRLCALAVLAAPLLVAAGAGLVLPGDPAARPAQPATVPSRVFLIGWVAAGLGGLFLVPNFYEHYMLPLALPLAAVGARALDRRPVGLVAGVVGVTFYLIAARSLEFADRAKARTAVLDIAGQIRGRDPQPRLFVYEGPMELYPLLGSYPPSPLLDTFHLYFPAEDNTSHLDTAAEVRRILAWQPSVVVTFRDFPPGEENARTGPLVRGYVRQRCRLWFTRTYFENYRAYPLEIWGDCAQGAGGAVTTGR